MNKNYKFWRTSINATKVWLLVCAMMFIVLDSTKAQTLINPATDGGFEVGPTFTDNGWTVVNGAAVNTWNLGNVPTGGIVTGNRCAYISNNGGAAHAYDNTSASVVHIYKDITFPAGQTNMNLSFNWLGNGETNFWDALIVSVVPTSYTFPNATVSLGTNALPAPAVELGRFWLQTTPQTANIAISPSVINNCTSAQTWRIVFTWKSDTSSGTNPPTALDNVSLVVSTPVGTPLAGSYSIGPSGSYATLTAAVTDLNSRGVSAPVVFELNSTYTSTGETFPITFSNLSCTTSSSTNNITIRPAAGSTGRVISGASASQLFNLNGYSFVTFDGRPGGSGASDLTITNTNTSGSIIQYINDAANNTIQYCTISGTNTSTTSGLVTILTTAGANGNDNININNNTFRDAASTPANFIYSSGTTTTNNTFNSNISITNNNFLNNTASAILATTGSSAFSISNNSFYQTASRAITTTYAAIQTAGSGGAAGGHTITNNFIGGTAPNCGGTPMTLTGSGIMRLLMLSGDITAPVISVQGNTIANINFTSSNTSNAHSLINLISGNFNIGNTTPNTLGSQTVIGNITVTLSGSAARFQGILAGTGTTPGNINISNNIIGGISFAGTGATVPALSVISLQGAATSYIVNNNVLGSPTIAGSISSSANSSLLGITTTSTSANQTYNGNLLNNIVNTNVGTAATVTGIICSATSTNFSVSNNTIATLSSSGASVNINGININNANIANVTRNKIYDLSCNNSGSLVNGINVTLATTLNISNNLIGDLRATAATGLNAINGINASATATYNVFYNTIRLSATSSSVTTFGTSCITFTSVITSFNLRNNILVNTSTPGATGGITAALRRSAAGTNGTVPATYATTSNNNLFWVNPTAGVTNYLTYVEGTVIGSVTNPMNTFAQMKAFMVNRDQNSVTENINFVSTLGSSIDFLRPTGATQAESGGAVIAGLTDAYNGLGIRTGYPLSGQLNGGGFSPDMGAYEGDFIYTDIVAPNITYTALSNVCVSTPSRVLVATITDVNGVPTSGAGLPMLYWRINAGAYTGVQGVSLGSNQYQFTFGGATVANDVVSYYVVAQDAFSTPNVGTFPSLGAAGFSVNPPAASTPPTTPTTYTHGAGLVGTYTVGVTGNFTTLTAAVAAFNVGCANGAIVFELIDATYPSETFPIVINQVPNAVTNTLTIRPSATVGAVNFVGNNALTLINLDGADYVTIDGRLGGTGASALTITNSNTSGSVIQYINDATNNTIQFCTISGTNTSTTSGLVFIAGTTGTTGNDNISINNNTFRDAASVPANLIFSNGSTTTNVSFNSNITISNNNFFNYNAMAVTASAGSSSFTINNNSFYQTASTALTTTYGAIQTAGSGLVSGGHTINNNFIGGTAPNCGGTPMTLTGSGVMRLLFLAGDITAPVISVQGNTIANINYTSSSASTLHSFISLLAGNFNIGTITGNTIGNATSTGNISLTLTGSSAGFAGFLMGTTATIGNINVANNTMGSITFAGTGTTNASFRGGSIANTPTSFIFNNNIFGSTTTSNSIQLNANSFTVGFISVSGALNQIYTNNTFANIVNISTGTSSALHCLTLDGAGTYPNTTGTYTVTNNTIRDIYSASGSTLISVIGLSATNFAQTSDNTLISQNTIFNIGNTNTTAINTGAAGMFMDLSTSAVVSRNLIHSLTNTATGTAPLIAGIFTNSGGVFQNNVIRLGLDNLGVSISSNVFFRGIVHQGTSGTGIYHNSVYIGGTAVVGASNTFAFQSVSTATTGRDYRNNIFVNARSNGAGTGKHYAISLPGTAANPAGLVSNYNVLQASGTGGVLGVFNAIDQTTLAGWNTATGMDVNSQNANPNFVNPTAIGATFSLNLVVPTPAEGQGILIPAITDDFLGQVRNTLSPVDIGAYAGNFSNVAISYTPLANACVPGARTLTATITSANGIPTSGAGLPVLYWRINAGAYQPSIATSLGSNQYQFSLGTGSLVGDNIFYYIVAQDNSSNVNASPSLGTTGLTANPPAATTPPTVPQTYTNIPSLSGTYLVGAGQTYTTLTAAVNAYNIACLTGAVTFVLTDATYSTGETFPIIIDANPQASSTNTLTIRPNVGVTSTISGSIAGTLIRLNGADFVTIDGSNTVGGTTRDLTITNTNTSTSSAVVWISNTLTNNSATNINVLNTIVVGNSAVTTLAGLGIGNSTISATSNGNGNNNISFINNDIRAAQYGVYASGENILNKNQNLVINNNLLNNVTPNNIGTSGIFTTFTNNITVSGNNIGNITGSTRDVSGINIGSMSATAFNGFSITSIGTTDGVSNVTITNNTISNVTQSGTYSALGIFLGHTASGTSLIANNVVSNIFSNGTSSDFGGGIVSGGGTGNINIYYNTVSMQGTIIGATAASQNSVCFGITSATAPTNLNVRNNIFSNTQVGNAGATSLRISAIALTYSTPFSGIINNNNLQVSGAGPGVYAVGYTGGFGGTAQTTFANWQTATGYDANSLNTDPIFTSATNLLPTSCRLDNKGVTIAGITTDIAAVTRNATTPDIGAYEFTPVLTISPATLTNATLNVLYTQTLTQTGILGALTWSVSAGALPAGITLSSAGVLSGTPSVAGTFNFTAQVTDGFCTNTRVYTLVVACPASITFGTPPVNGTAGTAYTHTLGQTGLGTVTWSISGGTLPTGLSLDGATGIISGTPTVSGTYNFTVQVQQSTCSYTQGYAVVIGCPVITFSPLSLPNGLVNTLYTSQVLSASAPGLSNNYTITLTTGSVPGMSFDSPTATWSGTPTTQGTYSLTFTAAHNTANCSTTYTYNFVVACATVTINPSLLPAATVGSAFSQVISQTGANPPFTWSLSAGTLPTGVTFDGATGTLSGTPTQSGTFNITVSLDLGGCIIPQPYAWVVNCPTIVFPNTSAVNAVAGASYTLNASTTGTTQTPTYSVLPALPAGLVLNTATGQITGTPTVTAASTTYTVTVSQTGGVCTKTQDYTFAVNCPTIVLNPATLPSPTVGNVYNQTLSTTGNASAVTFAVSSGALPAGITLNASTGVLSGAPSVSGAFSFDITATQANGPCTATRSYTWNIVCPTVSITTNSLANGTINVAYPAVTFTQTGYTGTFSWSATGLPTGFTINPTTGVFSGTTPTFGVYNVSVTLTQGICSVNKVLILQILSTCPAITVAPAQMPMGNVGAAYPATSIVATGGAAPYVYTVTSGTTLPAGLTLSAAGVISGTPTATGTVNVNVTATDANGCSGSTFYLITVNAACTAITITPATLNSGIIGTFYNQTLTSTGGTAPYSYTITTGTLPAGLTLGTSGSITGTTTAVGTSTFSVRVVDAIGCIGTANYTLVVNPVPTRVISISPATLNFPDVIIGQSTTLTFTITNNGNTPLTVSSIQYPVGFSGSFSGVIAAAGSQIVTVTFAPNVVGTFGGTVLVNSDAISGTSTLTVNGNGISNPTAIDNFGKPIVTVYPNPSASDFNVKFDNNSKGNYTVKVLDLTGKVVFEDNAEISDSVEEIQLRLGHLANGTYLLHLENKRGRAVVRIVRR
ncbi:MAG: DUF1573 domain-containing protein [Bacteroidetes bacterium]|nr:MAG: DUF1573 domain-containing protein [Bacteroidota bacterium]TAG90391.1 MAG: DUF1573 domain-containing protein [Bacteroidota bacterium]